MKQDLLYIDGTRSVTPDDNAVYNLSLDRVFEYVVNDIYKRREFLRHIASPPSCPDDISARQATLRDFISNTGLIDSLTSAVQSYTDEYAYFTNDRGRLFTSSKISDNDARSAFIVMAVHLHEQLKKLRTIFTSLSGYKLHSPLLVRLSDRLEFLTVTNRAIFDELTALTYRLSTITAEDTFTVTARLDDECRMFSCELREIKDWEHTAKAAKLPKKLAKNALIERLTQPKNALPSSAGLRNMLLGEGFREAAETVASLLTSLHDEFERLESGLEFYAVALEYYRIMRRKDIPMTFPTMVERPTLDIRGLYDALLCFAEVNASGVVPNDIMLDDATEGITIRGENNSGKTVYLRSVGCAAMLAQNGLPIPAETATCGIFSGIFTQFAAGEKEFEVTSDAGRFEQEVREIAAVIDAVDERSLVMLNESFQTTAYAEGAVGLYGVLRYLTEIDVKWIAVTHLPTLEGMFGDEVVRLRTTEGFKLVKSVKK